MKKILLIILFILNTTIGNSTIINIPNDYSTIQQGIDYATVGDTILVQPGTYIENLNITKNITLASLFLTTKDTSFIPQTIIDGNQQGSSIKISSLDSVIKEPVICGFTVINGNGSLTVEDLYGTIYYGGGILCIYPNPDLNDIVKPTLQNLIIENNYTESGGGIACLNASPQIIDVTIRNNTASADNIAHPLNQAKGGGLFCINHSNPSLKNVTITGNIASSNSYGEPQNGGGIACKDSSDVTLINSTISNNQVIGPSGYWGSYGGGIFCTQSFLTLKNVEISINTTSSGWGNGIYLVQSNAELTNLTMVDNFSYNHHYGLFIHGNGNYVSITNSIIYGHTNSIFFLYSYDTLDVSFSDIEYGETGIVKYDCSPIINWLNGNLDEDPLFSGLEDNPYQLSAESPCIDTGNPDTTGLNIPNDDLLGNVRIWDGDNNGSEVIDMGAFEFNSIPVSNNDKVNKTKVENEVLRTYPNPVIKNLQIETELHNTEYIEISLLNIRGQKIETIYSGIQNAGISKFLWGSNEYRIGVYFIKLKVKDREIIKKIVKR